MSVKSKHSSKKNSVGKKEKKKKLDSTLNDSDEDIESSEEELDLTKECHPIGYYLNDRTEMINQMFSVIKGNKLKAMLPPILKNFDIEQLKLQCLDQLLGMSDRRITCILDGESLETSSESEVIVSDEYDTDEKNGTTSGSKTERSNDSQDEYDLSNVDMKHKKRAGDSSVDGRVKKLVKTESEPAEQGKTLLEILELEMRARAIRALLKQSGNEKGSDQVTTEPVLDANEVKEVSSDVVDLTECEEEEFPPSVKKEATEEDIDIKVLNFEEKIEKSRVEKSNQQDDKSRKLQAELEIRNKLFKKKVYRTRQQRMESEEDEKVSGKIESGGNNINAGVDVAVKQEPTEPESIENIMEDPEEGEISTSEDESSNAVKQESTEVLEEDFETKIDKDAERVTAIDNGTFVRKISTEQGTENVMINKGEEESSSEKVRSSISTKSEIGKIDESTAQPAEAESETCIGETSWRDRWLQKDGVQKLVKSSKIYAKVKKRIAEKSQRAKEEVPIPYEVNSDSNSNSRLEMIEGSIEEYERLLGKSGNSQQPAPNEAINKISEDDEVEIKVKQIESSCGRADQMDNDMNI